MFIFIFRLSKKIWSPKQLSEPLAPFAIGSSSVYKYPIRLASILLAADMVKIIKVFQHSKPIFCVKVYSRSIVRNYMKEDKFHAFPLIGDLRDRFY